MKTNLDPIKELRQWVCWHAIRKGDKLIKMPMSPHGGKADTTDPQTWGTVQEAWRASNAHNFDGVGFVFTKGDEFVGVDLDHCFIDGRITDEAAGIVQALGSYTEMSPSREGLHIICRGTIPANINRSQTHGVEMYSSGRYFTVTGDKYLDVPIAECTEALNRIYESVKPPSHEAQHSESRLVHSEAVDPAQVAAALSYLPVWMDYSDWCNVLMAVHSVFPDETGIRLIEQWSPGFNGEVAGKWKTFKQKPGGITIGTLFHMARNLGWRFERNPHSIPMTDVVAVPVSSTVDDMIESRSALLLENTELYKGVFRRRAWVINAYTIMEYRLGVGDVGGSMALTIPALNLQNVVNVREETDAGSTMVMNTYPVIDTQGGAGGILQYGGDLVVTEQWDEAMMMFLISGEGLGHRIVGICTDEIDPGYMAPILRNAGKVTTFTNGHGSLSKKLAKMSRRVIHDCTLPVHPRVALQAVHNGDRSELNLKRWLDMATPVSPSH